MIKSSFQSKFKSDITAFIDFKQEFGHSYETQIHYLLDFDRFCINNYPSRTTLDEDIVMNWSSIKGTETSKGYASRISAIRQFGKYLVMIGKSASFILPDGFRGGNMPLMPYIFTEESLNQFFDYTDHMTRYYQSTVRHFVAPVMFRYMYACGLRPREARSLQCDDINVRTGRIFIRESKHYKERIIYGSDDLMSMTEKYLYYIKNIFPDSSALFVDRKGRPFTYDSQQYLFEHCRDNAGIRSSGTKSSNLYSFRHTFATFRIYLWIKEGKNLNEYIPKLSAYMGHSHYGHTLYYLHLIPETFELLAGYDPDHFSSLIPEVARYE